MWHFERIIDGKYKSAAWSHPYFRRGNKSLCSLMSRHGLPPKSEVAQSIRSQTRPSSAPKVVLNPKLEDIHPLETNPESLARTTKLNLEFMDLPWNKEDSQFITEDDCILATTKLICNLDNDAWTPIPTASPSADERSNSSKEGLDLLECLPSLSSNSSQEALDFLESLPPLFYTGAEATFEPTPLREPSCSSTIFNSTNAGLSELLEPITTMDDIF
jgi:hypothetical protein